MKRLAAVCSILLVGVLFVGPYAWKPTRERAEQACSQQQFSSYSVEWKLFPYPHFNCVDLDHGISVNLGWYPNS
mgnify:CR=1 FL=1